MYIGDAAHVFYVAYTRARAHLDEMKRKVQGLTDNINHRHRRRIGSHLTVARTR